MHPPLLSILSLFSLVLPSLGDRLEADYLRIGGALADYCIIVDSGSRTGDYSALDQFFTPNATFDFGAGVGAVQPLTEVIATFTKTFKKNIITQNAVTTESISVSNDTRSATAISYLTETFFGQGNLSDHIDAVYARLDDNLVKTNQTGNGGWRSRYRKTTYFVRQASSILSDACNQFY